jgi:flagellar protein FlaG
MSLQVNTRTAVPSHAATPPTAPVNPSTSTPKAAPAAPASRVDRVQLHHPEKVDLGFRAEEMRQNLKVAVDRLNEQLQRNGRDLSFAMDERIDRTVITVKNLRTGEVVRQIPTEEVVHLAHSIEDMKGLLFNKTM